MTSFRLTYSFHITYFSAQRSRKSVKFFKTWTPLCRIWNCVKFWHVVKYGFMKCPLFHFILFCMHCFYWLLTHFRDVIRDFLFRRQWKLRRNSVLKTVKEIFTMDGKDETSRIVYLVRLSVLELGFLSSISEISVCRIKMRFFLLLTGDCWPFLLYNNWDEFYELFPDKWKLSWTRPTWIQSWCSISLRRIRAKKDWLLTRAS